MSEDDAVARSARWWIPGAIFFFVLLSFRTVLRNDLVNWDDTQAILENPAFDSISRHTLRWAFSPNWGQFSPVTQLFMALEVALWGREPFAFHATSLVLHGINALLVYAVANAVLIRLRPGERFDDVRWAAAVAALFFALHPLRTEAVAWASAQGTLLATGFLLLATLAHLRGLREAWGPRAWRWIALSLFCFALSLSSRAFGLAFPFALLALDFCLGRITAERRRVLLEKAPLMIYAVGLALVTIVALRTHNGAARLATHTVPGRIVQAGYGIFFYPARTLAPFRLSPFYDLANLIDPFAPRFLLPALGALAIGVALIVLRKRWPAGIAAWLAFVLLVSPVLGLLQNGPQLVADRYAYHSCIPFALLAGGAALACLRGIRLGTIAKRWQVPLIAITGVTLVGFAMLSAGQARVWRTSISLWTEVLRLDPDCALAYSNRSDAWFRRKDLDRALDDLSAANRILPLDALGHFVLGNIRQAKGELPAAIVEFTETLRLDPKHRSALNNRGNAKRLLGNLSGAVADFDAALILDPKGAETYVNRAGVKAETGDITGALLDVDQAIALDERLPMARVLRGKLLMDRGDLVRSRADFETAVRLDPTSADLIRRLGGPDLSLMKQGS